MSKQLVIAVFLLAMPSFTDQIHLGDECPDHIKDVGADLGAGMCELVEGVVHVGSQDLPPRWKEMKIRGKCIA